MTTTVKLKNIAVVLKRPRYPENIGASARAMRNMGIEELILVDPPNCDSTRILRMATHAAMDIVEQMKVYETLKDALSSFNFVIGTTARLGKHRQIIVDPVKLAEKLVSISQENRITNW